jgi:prepilin-type N-terminal cleavage/methylation domain-containing protein
MYSSRPSFGAFTLIELLVVIVIIAILMGLAFPAYQAVQNQARKTQAKNDLVQIVNAVNAYYTEYGKYPLAVQGDDTKALFKADNSDVINTMRAISNGANAGDALNPRKIVFLSPPDVKNTNNPKAGVSSDGIFYDPWGKDASKPESGIYHIAIDGDYSNTVTNPYDAKTGAGPATLNSGVIAWSLGKDQKGGTGSKTSADSNDDIISWQ